MSDLIGLGTYARRIGKRQSTLQRYEDRSDFPKPALVIEEHNRTKRLWPRETLDLYFQQIDSERRAKQELARERAARKRATGALHRWAVTMFGPQDASFFKREQLRQHGGDPESVCTKLGIAY
jgi:hypothetical protein